MIVQAEGQHPYAFEKPMTHRSFFSHKVGIPFVERKSSKVDDIVDQKLVDHDSDEFHFENVPERDRTSSPSSGEEEIRSKIFPNVNRKRVKNVTTTTTASTTSLADEASSNSTLEDLLTSNSMPVSLSLKGRKDFQSRLKNHKVESLKPKLKPKPIFDYTDDEYYYEYVDDDDAYYDVEIPPRKTSSIRNNADIKNKISKMQR